MIIDWIALIVAFGIFFSVIVSKYVDQYNFSKVEYQYIKEKKE